MKQTIRCLLVSALLWVASARAHHSNAMYDLSKSIGMKGTVEAFVWTNPHVLIVLARDGKLAKDGKPEEEWRFESTSPGNLTREGWTKRSLKPGDQITIQYSPMRDGTHAGFARLVTLADGAVLNFNYVEKPNLP
jgi:hypothetical protein